MEALLHEVEFMRVDLPIIAVTACVVESFDYAAYGFDHLCRKPIDFSELIATIERCR